MKEETMLKGDTSNTTVWGLTEVALAADFMYFLDLDRGNWRQQHDLIDGPRFEWFAHAA